MIDWISRLLLDAGGVVAGLFISKDRAEFDVISDDGRDAHTGRVPLPACVWEIPE